MSFIRGSKYSTEAELFNGQAERLRFLEECRIGDMAEIERLTALADHYREENEALRYHLAMADQINDELHAELQMEIE